MVEYSWLIPLFPLFSFIMIVFFLNRNNKVSSSFAIAMVLTSFAVSVKILFEVLGHGQPYMFYVDWLIWSDFVVQMGIYIDPLTAVMLIVVTLVSSLVHIYSQGYMRGDPRYARFFAYLSLFTFSMLGLVVAGSYILVLVFWELVGLTSYLLIGFWFEKNVAANAGKKAFITTKFADLGFVLGLVLMIYALGTATMPEVNAKINHLQEVAGYVEAGAHHGEEASSEHSSDISGHGEEAETDEHQGASMDADEGHGAVAATDHAEGEVESEDEAKHTLVLVGIAGILMFAGACGKSAQFPFHVWLPDAMEGPTPVSALIHAATMVAAGVYLTARLMGIIIVSDQMAMVVAVIGAITAFMAASIGLVQNDIKRVLA
ncbi:MAG: hypothetical protein GY839_10585, partial [candidate division Zixibacteria bacterium]|nr:hypothetical protein [candidate division Zixibacteria bacterium]